MSFLADFITTGDGAFANENITFEDNSSIGALVDSDALSIDGPFVKDQLNLNDYTVTKITKYQWFIGDGNYYYENLIKHKFKEPGKTQVRLKVWSESFVESGKTFYFTSTITKEITVQSRFYKFLIDNFAIWDLIKNKEYDTLLQTVGSFFDKMHERITNIYNLTYIDKIDPKYFEILAQTLGHETYYRKVGYNISAGDFSSYDIIDKIENNVASESEINAFRIFLTESSSLFKKKGTPEDISRFLSYFSINGKTADLWTTNFGKSYKGKISENFAGKDFKVNKLTLSWIDINVFGSNNDKTHYAKNDGSLIVDTYHKVQKYEYDMDIFTLAPVIHRKNPSWSIFELPRYVKEVKYVGDTYYTPIESWMTPKEISSLIDELYDDTTDLDLEKRIVYDDIKISPVSVAVSGETCVTTELVTSNYIKYIPTFLIKDARLEDGIEIVGYDYSNDINPYIVDWQSYAPSAMVIDVTAIDMSACYKHYPYVQVQNFMEIDDLFEVGEKMSLSFTVANEDDIESFIASKEYKARNLDISSVFEFAEPEKYVFNKKLADNQISLIFRGINTNLEIKNNINTYYKLTVCGKDSVVNVCKIIPSKYDSVVYQKLNLTGDRDNIINDSIIYDIDVNGKTTDVPFVFEPNTRYELKLSLTESLLSAWVRKLTKETELHRALKAGLGSNYIGKDVRDDLWIPLVENLDLNATQENVTTYNIKNQKISTISYDYVDGEGLLGFGTKNSTLVMREFVVNNRDFDTTLYDDIQKQIYLKPKYLEWQRRKDIILSSYDNSVPFFDAYIEKSFDSSTKNYTLTNEQASSLQGIYFNNIQVNDKLATRYTIWFDKQWLIDNYSKDNKLIEDFYSKIVIPFGSQRSPFIAENTVYGEEMYRNLLGSESSGCGHFIANNSVIFDKYETIPHDNFSSVTRSGSGYGNELYLSDKLIQYKLTGRDIGYRGVYEEIAPLSNYFTELDGKKTLNDQTIFKNTFFNPVIVDTECGRRVIGVRFRNCKDILTTIKNYTTELQKEIYLYGSFTFHVPKYSVKYAPDSDFTQSSILNDYVEYTSLIPLGILNENIKTYNLSKEYIKDRGNMLIVFNGAYVKLSSDKATYSSLNNKITLKNANQYENTYNELACRYWVCADLNLSSEIFKENEVYFENYENDSGINFFIGDNLRKLLTKLEDTSTYSLSGDYNWWLPTNKDILGTDFSGAYRKRNFNIITVDTISALTTNLNYFGYDETPMVSCEEQRNRAEAKVIFGNKVGGFNFSYENSLIAGTQCVTAVNTLKALQIRFTDGNSNIPIVSETPYYAKISVRMNYSGFDQDNLDIMPENEKEKVKILGAKKKDRFVKAPVVKCLTFVVPFSWYDRNHMPDDNMIEYANFIRGAYGAGEAPSITFSPFGLMTELLNRMDEINKANILNSGINLTDWNKYLLENLSIDEIYEPIPSSVCKLYKNYGLFNNLQLNLGSYIELKYNKSDFDWDVTTDFRYFFDGKQENFFALPKEINTMDLWVENIRDVTLNGYMLSDSLYNISNNNILTLSDDASFNLINGSEMYGKYMLNLYLDVFNTKQNNFTVEKYTQNFNNISEINFIPYEAPSDETFSIVERTSSEELVFMSDDKLYETVKIGGEIALNANIENTKIRTSFGKAGSLLYPKDININLSPMPDIQKLFMIDENSPVFDITSDVYFGEELDSIGDYRGKKFEYVIKANSSFDIKLNKYILDEYYFVGIGTYDFDVALGVAKYDHATGTFKKSFLTGFGDYNTKNIKSKVWYKLRVIASKDYIRVIFNERTEPERLIINYSISPKNSDKAGVNEGKYEELAYLVKGINNLDITYIDEIGTKAGKDFVEKNVDVALSYDKRPAGFMTGFVVFNKYTYVTNISYMVQKPKIRHFASVSDNTNYTTFLTEITQKFDSFSSLKFIGKTLNNTIVVHVDDKLYYSDKNGHPVKYINSGVIETDINDKYVIIKMSLNNSMNVIVVPENFKNERSIFIKDNNFNIDQIYRYLIYTNKSIENVFISNNQISIVLNT